MKQKINTYILVKNFGLILVLILSFWAIQPFFISGFFPMHDDTQVARVFEMGKMLKSGIFPVRWVPDLGYGYGYPIFNFYAPLAYYFGGLLTVIGFDTLIATKIMMVVGILLAGVFMYLLAKEFWGTLGGIISGLFYVYAPYHALDIYVRGDVAELWAYAFIPLMFWGIYKVFDSPLRSPSAFAKASVDKSVTSEVLRSDSSEVDSVWKWIAVGSIGYAGVILSHNLTALMVTPFLIVFIVIEGYLFYRIKNLYVIRYTLYAFILGLALSAFYWIPALLEMKYTNVLSQVGGGADFSDHFVCLQQLWSSHWGFGGSAKGCIDGMSFMVGKLHTLSVIAFISILVFNFLKHRVNHFNNIYYLSIFAILSFLISIFLMLDISKFLWEAIPIMVFFQYPWRFLIMISFFSSLLSGFAIWFLTIHLEGVLRPPSRWAAGIGFVILIFSLLFFNLKFFVPQTIFPATSKDFTNEIALKWTASKTSDEFLPPDFKKPKSEYEIGKKPIEFRETAIEKSANVVSFIGALALIVGIIFKYAKIQR